VTGEQPIFNRLALIGFGLIGGSIARAVRAQGTVCSIVATARSPQTRKRVAELGVVDQVVESNAAAVEGADLVIVCIPVGACGDVAKEIGPHLMKGATVSDVGSVKGSVMRDMAPHLPQHVHFIPAHPVAGTEHSGPDSGFAELFVNRWCILTPPPDADQAAVEKLATFWRKLGANVETMPADHHDLVLGITSHLPHLIAYTIVGTADELSEVTRSEVLKFSAGGFLRRAKGEVVDRAVGFAGHRHLPAHGFVEIRNRAAAIDQNQPAEAVQPDAQPRKDIAELQQQQIDCYYSQQVREHLDHQNSDHREATAPVAEARQRISSQRA